ncbi:nucleotidyl transferase AbiEii/AbiGii toxin family protein [Massilia sp. DJPM01]|uniref:nucleotidyl transferase AbiEii/AbiGii toxin family protein n=1 Tax=Massilia sp. DJPM01 TaxID=3024404 RepID=UPI00259F7DC8|nr:nucleotidyl transferase AbiEii/AbiGii toxin family protein [Massilia sp. DJPM01]MDM5179103.1 nucleotidyl transferase AbiEii/AbiGii toxin family protein [Massilia sp. DJPM01]
MRTELQLKTPIDDATFAVIREIGHAAAALGHNALLVGATARIILVEHVFGLPAGRATRDVDFAFAIDTWDQFDALRQRLIGQHQFQADAHTLHKLYYRPTAAPHAIPVDLVPFGTLGGEREEIRWPPDMAIVMNVAGFADALASAVSVEIGAGVSVAIASLPAIAVLKLFAWRDRRRGTHKDATDLTALMLLYHDIDQERVYTVPEEVLEDVDFDIELGGVWLLGNDARKLSLAPTTEKLTAMLADTAQTDALISDMARALLTKADPDGHAARLLGQFKAGFGVQ